MVRPMKPDTTAAREWPSVLRTVPRAPVPVLPGRTGPVADPARHHGDPRRHTPARARRREIVCGRRRGGHRRRHVRPSRRGRDCRFRPGTLPAGRPAAVGLAAGQGDRCRGGGPCARTRRIGWSPTCTRSSCASAARSMRAFYESPKYLDLLERAVRGALMNSLSFMWGFYFLVQAAISLVAIIAVLSTIHWAIPVAMVLSALPQLIATSWFARRGWALEEQPVHPPPAPEVSHRLDERAPGGERGAAVRLVGLFHPPLSADQRTAAAARAVLHAEEHPVASEPRPPFGRRGGRRVGVHRAQGAGQSHLGRGCRAGHAGRLERQGGAAADLQLWRAVLRADADAGQPLHVS